MSYQCLRTDGNGYAYRLSANCNGLNMGLSDFMVEARIRTVIGSNEIIDKYDGSVGYQIYIHPTTGRMQGMIKDSGGLTRSTDDGVNLADDRWHYVVIVFDRSGNMTRFVDGSIYGTVDSISSRSGDISGAQRFTVGASRTGTSLFIGLIDEVRVWNFGYGGLPADYEAYITWRAAGRNVFLDIGQYNGGAWNGYADADRNEILTDPGLENWSGNLLDDWGEAGLSGGVRDLFDENGTGGGNFHGGSHAAKLEATLSDGTDFKIYQNGITLATNIYYSLNCWYHFSTRTVGAVYAYIWNAVDGSQVLVNSSSITAVYTYAELVFKVTSASNSLTLRLDNETTTGIVYFDDISLKRVGLVAHYKFDGTYDDETTNANHLTEGGSNNVFPGYTLKKTKIISPFWIK